eukprot:scaffold122302_cov53-Phaeocystis_antarctica.AAC.1
MEECAFSAGDRQRASAALSMSCHARQPPARSRDDAVGEPPTPRAPEDGERTAPSHRPGLALPHQRESTLVIEACTACAADGPSPARNGRRG